MIKTEIKYICNGCGKEFIFNGPISKFNRSVNHYCSSKECLLSIITKHGFNSRDKDKNKFNDAVRFMLLNKSKSRVKINNIEWNLKLEDIPEIPKKCPLLNIELKLDNKKTSYNSPSLDRIDNSKGYIKGNIQIISHRANTLKRDSTFEEIEMIYNYIKQYDMI